MSKIGYLSIIAGNTNGTSGPPVPGPSVDSGLNSPKGVTVDNSGNVYIADCFNNVVEKLTPDGLGGYTLSIIAGTGTAGLPTNGPALNSNLRSPCGIDNDNLGNLFVADSDNNLIEKLTPDGLGGYNLTVIAGINTTNNAGLPTNGPALNSTLSHPIGIDSDNLGNLFIADWQNNIVEKLTPDGLGGYNLTVIAGINTANNAGLPTPGPSVNSALNSPWGVATDNLGNVYIADSGNNIIEKLVPDGFGGYNLSIIAGDANGTAGLATPGPALNSLLTFPAGIAEDNLGNLFVADSGNNIIEKLVPDGSGGYNLSIIAGDANGTAGLATDGPALDSLLNFPVSTKVDLNGNFYITDTFNNLVEKVIFLSQITCFKEDTLILTNKGYIPIQNLKKGDLIQTFKNGLVPINTIGKKQIYHPALHNDRIKDQLYKYSKEKYPKLLEDLVITGCHSVLVNNFASQEQKDKTLKLNNNRLFKTDNKYRLPACVDDSSSVYEIPGNYIVFHFALEHDDCYMNYGVYANGLLVETTSKRYMKELSNMTLIE